MRISEVICEAATEPSQVANLSSILELLRNRAVSLNQEPKIRVDSLVNMMRNQPGSEMFNVGTLLAAAKDSDAIKNLVKDIKPDANQIRYVYLQSPDMDSEYAIDTDQANVAQDPTTTVDQMAKRAMNNRS